MLPGHADMTIHPGPAWAPAIALLTQCGLPTQDLTPAHLEHFLGCMRDDRLLGVIGLEAFGATALLRSLAVAEEARAHGCGTSLVAELEARAARQGVAKLFLLTNTAERFFHALGYRSTARAEAPPAIATSREFSSLCPDSAVLMMKTLVASP